MEFSSGFIVENNIHSIYFTYPKAPSNLGFACFLAFFSAYLAIEYTSLKVETRHKQPFVFRKLMS